MVSSGLEIGLGGLSLSLRFLAGGGSVDVVRSDVVWNISRSGRGPFESPTRSRVLAAMPGFKLSVYLLAAILNMRKVVVKDWNVELRR
jgi:hypothetical protein